MDQHIPDRSWMYDRKYQGKRGKNAIKARFMDGVKEFVTLTKSQDICKSEGGLRCPCFKCMCGNIKSPEDVINHLEKFGFMRDYYVWRHHGEEELPHINYKFDVNTHATATTTPSPYLNQAAITPTPYLNSAVTTRPPYLNPFSTHVGLGSTGTATFPTQPPPYGIPGAPVLLEHQRIDETTKKNRISSKGGNLYTQGCVDVSIRARQPQKKLGRCAFIDKIYDATHIRQDMDSYVDDRAASTQEKYNKLVKEHMEQHPEYSSYAEILDTIELQLWNIASGLETMNKRYGSLFHVPNRGEESRPGTLTHEAEVQQLIETLTQQLQSQKKELERSARWDQEMRERLDKLDRYNENSRKWKEDMSQYFASMNCQLPPPPYESTSYAAPTDSGYYANEEEDDQN